MSRLATIQQMLADNPQDSFLRFALAKEHEKSGDDHSARETYEALLADDPEYVGTYYHLGKTLERVGEAAAAWKIYGEGMAVCQRLGEAHARAELAGARLELGDEDDFE